MDIYIDTQVDRQSDIIAIQLITIYIVQIDRQMNRWIQMNEQIYKQKHRWIYRQIHRWMDRQADIMAIQLITIDICLDRQADIQIDIDE